LSPSPLHTPIPPYYCTFIPPHAQANIFGSDPYVEIRSTREQLLKSECIYSTLNPEWEETFDVVGESNITFVAEKDFLEVINN
jgi:hypothetical protein